MCSGTSSFSFAQSPGLGSPLIGLIERRSSIVNCIGIQEDDSIVFWIISLDPIKTSPDEGLCGESSAFKASLDLFDSQLDHGSHFHFSQERGRASRAGRFQQQAAAVDQYGNVHLVEPSSSQVVLRTSPLWPLEALNLEQRRPCDYSGLLPRLRTSKEADRIERHNFHYQTSRRPKRWLESWMVILRQQRCAPATGCCRVENTQLQSTGTASCEILH